MKTLICPAVSLFIALTVITGLAYPLLTTAIGKVAFSDQVNGSLIERNRQLVGSSLIGQNFSAPRYFWGRPSATGPMPYNGVNSGGSNFGPSNPAQKSAVADRISALHAADPENKAAIPVDLVTASASGLDPQVSPAAVYYQLQRVAKARNLSEASVRQLVEKYVEPPQLGLLGEYRVNILQLNLALDQVH